MSDAFATIRARRAEIARAIELLRAEDEELLTTEVVLERLSGQPGQTGVLGEAQVPRRTSRPRSQREFVLNVLGSSDSPWLKTRDIVKQAKSRWGAVLPEPSLRPLLSVMKRQKLIVRHGRLVALRERALELQQGARRQDALRQEM